MWRAGFDFFRVGRIQRGQQWFSGRYRRERNARDRFIENAACHFRRVVIAGLGLGFTLQEVLADKRVERVSVVEIEGARHFGPNTHPGAVATEILRLVSRAATAP